MKDLKFRNVGLALVAAVAAFSSCSSDDDGNDNPAGGTPATQYPTGAVVWKEDTTVILKDHLIIPVGTSLYIQPGVKVIAASRSVKPEVVVLGNLYSMGTAEKPVVFTVADSLKDDNRFSRNWGGIICGFDSKELYLEYTNISYCGAQTTDESESYKHGLFKTETGEGVPAVHFCNPAGRMVIRNCRFENNAEDQIYITGGRSIVCDNHFISSGEDGGEAINYKSDCLADIAYNVIYDANTNGFKLSNAGFTNLQSHLVCYNNTIVNTGWRRPKTKGGSIWLETNVRADLYNNLIYDCRYALKHSTDEGDAEDPASVITPNYYFASTQKGVDQMVADESLGILNGASCFYSRTPGEGRPLFVNYTQQATVDVNSGLSGNAAAYPQAWNNAWDFRLKAGSPAATGGKTDFERIFAVTGIEMQGLEGLGVQSVFVSPAPSTFFGACGIQ